MREGPSDELRHFLQRTGLASAEDLSAAAGKARRLVRGLPLFDSVWIDALAQAHALTPYQARQINAGFASSLEIGPYLVRGRLPGPALGHVFEARQLETQQEVRLFVADVTKADCAVIEQRARRLVEQSRRLDDPSWVPVEEVGIDVTARRPRFWAASRPVEGVSASEWLIPHGRFSTTAVLEIARQMAAAMAKLERAEILHTDISTANVVLTDSGDVVLPMPGLRAILRPEEGYGHADLAPEGYDTLAVERLVEGSPQTVSSELFACGCLWWHLLAGRPPMPGGDSISKLRNVHKSKILSVRQWAPDVPEVLESAIQRCTRRDPAERGASFAELAQQLGASTRAHRAEVAACVRRHRFPTRHVSMAGSASRDGFLGRYRMFKTLAVGVVVALLAAGTWIVSQTTMIAPTASIEVPHPTSTDEKPVEPLANADVRSPPSPSASPGGRDGVDANVIRFSAADASEGRLPRLRPGATLRGDPHARPRIEVPPQGLSIGLSHLRFENIDFVWRHTSSAESGETPAMLRVQSGWVEFHQCTFQTADLPFGAVQPVAIETHAPSGGVPTSPGSGSVRVIADECIFRGVAAGIDVRSSVQVAIDADHSLFLGPGPFVRLQFAPVVDRPVSIALSRFTLRGATALVACRYDTLPESPGKLSITAEHTVLSPQVGGTVMRFEGTESPEPLLRQAVWSGEGSLLSVATPIADWHDPDGRTDTLPETLLSMDGITRSRFQFVSPQTHLPASSGIQKVSAPLRGDQPPGIEPNRLRLPALGSSDRP